MWNKERQRRMTEMDVVVVEEIVEEKKREKMKKDVVHALNSSFAIMLSLVLIE